MKPNETDRQGALEFLRKTLKPGDKIYTITRHVSRSGMVRRISVFIVKDGVIFDLDYQIAEAGLYSRHHSEEGLVVGGCGMDMHFSVVYELGRALYPDGFKLPKGSFRHFGHDDTPGFERDGGYAFQKETL